MGLQYITTQTNFLMIKTPIGSKETHKRMLKEGVIIRPMEDFGIKDFIRINIGLPEENERFIRTLKRFFNKLDSIITIDGPTGSGKSTVSRLLAERLSYRYLDTGAMYRAVAIAALDANVNLQDINKVEELCNTIDIEFVREGESTKVLLNDKDVTKEIRHPSIDLFASNVSGLDIVRQTMVRLQRNEGIKGRLVAEGRDMGTVVFPDATHKFYLDASMELRVTRRFRERQKRGEPVSRER